jgi:ribosome biogenesis GTPase / thiamine phosphate phosphatase
MTAEHVAGLARVVACHGRRGLVRLPDGSQRAALTRGRQLEACVGDFVALSHLSEQPVVIETIEPRRNEFKRSDHVRTKRLAANIDRIAVVLASSPPFSEELLLRTLVCARAAGIEAILIANKADLPEPAEIGQRLALYESLGYPVLRVSARQAPDDARHKLLAQLQARTTLLLGQSGMGKSTLVNLLVPQARLLTQTISEALGSGRHTTTASRGFDLPEVPGMIIDSPGFQTFGLAHLSASEIVHAMPEFVPLLGQCRFHNCTHRQEPACAIRGAVAEARIDPWRHALYERLVDENSR